MFAINMSLEKGGGEGTSRYGLNGKVCATRLGLPLRDDDVADRSVEEKTGEDAVDDAVNDAEAYVDALREGIRRAASSKEAGTLT